MPSAGHTSIPHTSAIRNLLAPNVLTVLSRELLAPSENDGPGARFFFAVFFLLLYYCTLLGDTSERFVCPPFKMPRWWLRALV